MRLFLLALVGGVLLALTGCVGETKHTVSGTAKYNGEAIPDGHIAFVHESSGASGGGTITNGQYKVDLAPGKYRVQINASKQMPLPPGKKGMGGATEEVREYIPAEYNAESKLTAEVPGTNPHDFDLKSP